MAVSISISYEGNLRTKAVHGPSGATILTDAPVDNHGRGEAFSPTDLVAGALGSCMATIIGIVAQRKNIDLTGMRIDVQKHMTTTPPRRIDRLEVDIHLPVAADHPDRALLENAALTCPVHHSLLTEIEKPVRFHWQG